MLNVNCSITIAWAYTYCTYIMTHPSSITFMVLFSRYLPVYSSSCEWHKNPPFLAYVIIISLDYVFGR